jgi:hypothetical protein
VVVCFRAAGRCLATMKRRIATVRGSFPGPAVLETAPAPNHSRGDTGPAGLSETQWIWACSHARRELGGKD